MEEEEWRTTKDNDDEEEAFSPWDYGKLMNYKFLLSCSSPDSYFGNNNKKLHRGFNIFPSFPSNPSNIKRQGIE